MFRVPDEDVPKFICLLPFLVIYLVLFGLWEGIVDAIGRIRNYFRKEEGEE